MHRGYTINLSLAGMLLFLLFTLSSLFTPRRTTGGIYYYNEEGTMLYRKDSAMTKYYVIKTKRAWSEIYSEAEDTTYAGTADVNTITSIKAGMVELLIWKKLVDSSTVQDNIVEIFGPDVLGEMLSTIQDDGQGGDNPLNNKEYGGLLNSSGEIIFDSIGRQGVLCGGSRTVSLPTYGFAEFHSHPSGCIGRMWPWPCPYNIPGDHRICGLGQGPSKKDQQAIDGRIGYIFAMRARIVFIYDKTGVIATLPFHVFKAQQSR